MSFSLWLVSGKNSSNELSRLYQMDEAEAELQSDSRLAEAGGELLKLFPALEKLGDDEIDDSPWAGSPEITDKWIHLSISFSKVDLVFEKGGEIFQKYGLLGYDPQNDEVFG